LALTRLANTALDRVIPRNIDIAAEIARFAATDLLCYRVETPVELAARQNHAWQPLLDWAAARFGAELTVTAAITPVKQPEAALARLQAEVASRDAMELTALHLATSACTSLILGLALSDNRLTPEEAFALAELEANFEIERWGEDEEQSIRRAALQDDIATAARFLALLRQG
jgi:chaperone required for assembly of F1-ATPase